MPKVIINEIDRTQYNVTTNESDNIVYVPGIALIGPVDKPYLCRSYTEFVALFGETSPNRDEITITSWEYATSLLLNGFPVLFRRIVGDYDSTTDTYSLSAKASAVFTDGGGTPVTQFTVTANDPGTSGNYIYVILDKGTLEITSNAVSTAGSIKFSIYSIPFVGTSTGIKTGTPVLEKTYETETFAVGTTDTDVFAAFKDLLDSVDSKLVTVTTESTFAIYDDWFADEGKTDLTGGTDPSEANVMTYLATPGTTIFNELVDKDLYDVKFLTLGGKYAANTTEQGAITELVRIASERGDCIAIPDLPYSLEPSGTVDPIPTYFDFLNTFDSTGASSYAAAYDPWYYFKLPVVTTSIKLTCGSFIFLYELAKSIKNGNPIWLPPAGVNRGLVPEATGSYFEIGSVIANEWSEAPRFVNPIRTIKGYGYAIFGQKTLYKVDGSSNVRSAFQDLSVRITANEIKRKIRDISIGLTFENNNLKTWNEFRAELDPYLTSIAADGALDNYKIIMDSVTTTEDDINNNTVRGTVIVQIARAAEDFNIDFIVTNSSTEFEESYT